MIGASVGRGLWTSRSMTPDRVTDAIAAADAVVTCRAANRHESSSSRVVFLVGVGLAMRKKTIEQKVVDEDKALIVRLE